MLAEATIRDEIVVLSKITRRPSTTAELRMHWRKAFAVLDQILTRLREDGVIACTNGVWWRRGATTNNGKAYDTKNR